MSAWNQRRLHVPKSGLNPKLIFDVNLRTPLGSRADEVWVICLKFVEKEMWFDAFMIVLAAVQRGNAEAVCAAINGLNEIWDDVVVSMSIPPRSQMTDLNQETLANSFLIADSAISVS